LLSFLAEDHVIVDLLPGRSNLGETGMTQGGKTAIRKRLASGTVEFGN